MIFLDNLLDIISYTDPAAGKTSEEVRKTKARQAIVTIGQDTIGRVFCLEAWASREATTAQYIDQLILTWETWHAKRFGVEANGMQVLFGQTVQMLVEMQGYRIPFESVYQPTNVKKAWRNRTRLQPLTAHGRLFIRNDQHELFTELTNHPHYPTNDLVDALATACSMLPDRTHQVQRQDDEMRNLAKYLRESGAPPSYIQQRMEELRTQRLEQAFSSISLPLAPD